jgi:hypothetical protein
MTASMQTGTAGLLLERGGGLRDAATAALAGGNAAKQLICNRPATRVEQSRNSPAIAARAVRG